MEGRFHRGSLRLQLSFACNLFIASLTYCSSFLRRAGSNVEARKWVCGKSSLPSPRRTPTPDGTTAAEEPPPREGDEGARSEEEEEARGAYLDCHILSDYIYLFS